MIRRNSCKLLALASLVVVAGMPPAMANNDLDSTDRLSKIHLLQNVRELKRHKVADQILYHKIEYRKVVAHIVQVDLSSGKWDLVPSIDSKRKKTSKFALDTKSVVAINAGYFNMTDGVSASYVYKGGKLVCDPKKNKALVGNKSLKPFLDRIFNRRELRIYKNSKGRSIAKVLPHNAEFKTTMKLESTLQAGPQLLPFNTSKEGAFIRVSPSGKKVDSIGTGSLAARSAIGITKSGVVFLVCVEGARTKEFSSGANLALLSNLLKELGCSEALNFDGGTSTSLVVKGLPKAFGVKQNAQTLTESGYTVLFAHNPERKVKSVLCVIPVTQ